MWTDFYWALLAGCALDLLLGDPANTSAGARKSCGPGAAICGEALYC